MGKIVDISHYQGAINWDEFAKEADLVVIRVQDGSSTVDKRYQEYVAEAKKRGIPFGHYAFTRFVNANDAKKEAQDFYARGDKDALFWVTDVEVNTTADMAGATQAFVDELRRLGAQKVGGYFAHNGYLAWGLDKVSGLDFKWFPRYGVNDGAQHTKPAYDCDLWQYTSVGRVAGVNTNVDLNVLVGDKSLEWFTGANCANPAQPSGFIMVVRAIGEGDIRAEPSHTAGFIRNTRDGELFNVISIQNDWHQVAVSDTQVGWIDGNNGQNLYWVDNPALKGAGASQYYTVKSGDTLGKIAKANGVTIAQLQAWNGIKDANKISVGQKLRVK